MTGTHLCSTCYREWKHSPCSSAGVYHIPCPICGISSIHRWEYIDDEFTAFVRKTRAEVLEVLNEHV